MQFMFIETETTPNPSTLKFLPGELVMATGTREFTSPEAAEASPLAQAPLFTPGTAAGIAVPADADDDFNDSPEDAEIIEQIKDLIETRVRPAVANDGGDIIYRGFREGVVYLQMQGACSGCPSSSATLKNGIESLLKHYVPEVSEVRAA